MYSLNRAEIIGNLTRDPEVRFTPNGQAVASFAVATNRRWRDKDGSSQEATEFHDIVVWGKLAETIGQILHKGNKVYVEGRLQTRSWEAQDGAKRSRTEIIMENFIPLTAKGTGASNEDAVPESVEEFSPSAKATGDKPQKQDKKADDAKEDEINLDEIPF